MRLFRHACVTGNVEELMAVLHADATLVSDGGGKAAAATRPVLGAARIAKFVLGYAGKKMHWSESDFQLVTINGAPGLLMRHGHQGRGHRTEITVATSRRRTGDRFPFGASAWTTSSCSARPASDGR